MQVTNPTSAERRLNKAIRHALFSMALVITNGAFSFALAAETQAIDSAVKKPYHIPAGPLGRTLSSFAANTGTPISFDPALTEGLTSPAIAGTYSTKEAIAKLLEGSGLEITQKNDGSYSLKKAPVALTPKNDRADTLPEVAVSATAEKTDTTENSNSYTSNIVSIGKGKQTLREIPQSISIVTRQRMDDQNMTTLAEAMQQTTGMTVVNYGSNTAGINSRGYGLDVIQIDGIPVQDSQGAWGTSSQDLTTYDRIEVLRGPAGLLQGTGEPGGTVNLVRKRAMADYAIKTSLFGGSWDNYRGEVDVTGALDSEGKVRGRLVAMYQDKKSFIDDDFARKPLIYGTLEFDLTPQTTISVGATITSMDSRPTFGLPTYEDGRVADISRSTFIGSDWDNKHENSNNYFMEAEHRLNNGGELKLRVSALERRFGLESSAFGDSYIDTAGNFDRVLLGSKGKTSDYGIDAFLTQPFNVLGREHNILIGLNSRVFNSSTAYAQIYGATQNIFSPQHSLAKPDFIYEPADVFKTSQTGVYGQTRLQVLDNTKLIFGGRLSNWEIELKNNPNGNDKISQKFTPYGGLVFDLTEQFSLYASYSDIFQPQYYSLGANNKILEPRTGNQYEVGVKGELQGGKLNLHAALFRINDENRAMTDPNNPNFSISAGKVRSQGFETEISGRLNSNWDVMAGYAYTETEYLQAEDGLKGLVFATNTPKHNFKLWNKYRISGDNLSGWSIGAGLNILSGVYAYNGVSKWVQDGYTLASAQVDYRVNKNWDLSLTGNNLFDKKYYSRMEGWSRQTYFGDPRNFMLTLRGNF